MPERDIHLEPIPLGEPVYTLAKNILDEATKDPYKDPYTAIGKMLTAVSLYAYAAQLACARKGFEWEWEELPRYPIEITIVPYSLPEKLLDKIVEAVRKWVRIYIDSISSEYKQCRVHLRHNIESIPLIVLIAFSRNKEYIEKALPVFEKLLDILKESGAEYMVSFEFTYDDGVPSELMGKQKRFIVYHVRFWKFSLEKFEKVIDELGFIKREITSLSSLKIIYGEKNIGSVKIVADCGSDGYGFIQLEFYDTAKIINELSTAIMISEEGVRIENVVLKPITIDVRDVERKTCVFVRKVQKIGSKLAVYLTEPFTELGIEPGEQVRVVVDFKKKQIIITKN